jgi:glycosyltransferase involved in cell wall biosynthesis
MNLIMVIGDTALARGERGAFYNTLSEFARYWDAVHILTPHVAGLRRVQCFDNVVLHPSPWPRLLQPWFVLRKGRALAAARPYHLVASHDYGLFLNGLGAAWLSQAAGLPHVSEIHHVEGHPRAASWRERLQPVLAEHYVRWACDRVRGFRIVNAGELRPLMQGWGVPDTKLLVLYSLYLDFDHFHPEPVEPVYDAIFVGRLAPNKAPLLFLEGLRLARDRVGPLRGLVVGRGPLATKMKARARDLGLEVEFVEWVDSPAGLAQQMRSSRCLVCTSYSEGGPRVVAEALASGVPVITTRVGLAQELVRDGQNGFLVDGSPGQLAARLAALIQDRALQSAMGRAAPAAVARFDRKRVIRDYALGLQSVIL